MGVENKVVGLHRSKQRIGRATGVALGFASGSGCVVRGSRADRLKTVDDEHRQSWRAGWYTDRSDVRRRQDVQKFGGPRCERSLTPRRSDHQRRDRANLAIDALRVGPDWESDDRRVNIKGVLYGIAAALPVFQRHK